MAAVLAEDPFRLSIDILEGEGNDQYGVRLQAVLPPDNPNVPPELELFIVRRVGWEQLQGVTDHVLGLVEENLGMPMLFTLASEAKDWLRAHVGDEPDLEEVYERSKQTFETFSDEKFYDQEVSGCRRACSQCAL